MWRTIIIIIIIKGRAITIISTLIVTYLYWIEFWFSIFFMNKREWGKKEYVRLIWNIAPYPFSTDRMINDGKIFSIVEICQRHSTTKFIHIFRYVRSIFPRKFYTSIELWTILFSHFVFATERERQREKFTFIRINYIQKGSTNKSVTIHLWIVLGTSIHVTHIITQMNGITNKL